MKINFWFELIATFVYNKVFLSLLIFIIGFFTSYSQQTEKVDFINVNATVQPIFPEKKVKAAATDRVVKRFFDIEVLMSIVLLDLKADLNLKIP